MIDIMVNGEPKTIACKTSLEKLLLDRHNKSSNQDNPTPLLAIEINQHLVPKKAWPDTILCDQDRIEIIRLVGGG